MFVNGFRQEGEVLKRRWFLGSIAAGLCGKDRVRIIAHRGEHLKCPENTLPAIDEAIRLGADFVEIDVRTTRDGKYVLMHDAGVERTTGGRGLVEELTLAEIRSLDAGSGRNGFQGTRVPTLDEAFELMRGRCGVYLDAKRIPASAIVAALRKFDLEERAVVYGSLSLMRELQSLGMGHAAMPEAQSEAVVRQILAELPVKVIAFDRRDFEASLVQMVRAAGRGVFVDRLGDEDHPEKWQQAIRMGATGIQTDHPAELAEFLSRGGVV